MELALLAGNKLITDKKQNISNLIAEHFVFIDNCIDEIN